MLFVYDGKNEPVIDDFRLNERVRTDDDLRGARRNFFQRVAFFRSGETAHEQDDRNAERGEPS